MPKPAPSESSDSGDIRQLRADLDAVMDEGASLEAKLSSLSKRESNNAAELQAQEQEKDQLKLRIADREQRAAQLRSLIAQKRAELKLP
jgi:hypothetical protein